MTLASRASVASEVEVAGLEALLSNVAVSLAKAVAVATSVCRRQMHGSDICRAGVSDILCDSEPTKRVALTRWGDALG